MKVRFSAKVKMFFSAVHDSIKKTFISVTEKIFILLDVHNKSWKQILKEKKLFFIFLGFLLFLYIAPHFIFINKYKTNIENKINTTFNVKTNITGNISYSVLPRPVILLRDVEIFDKDGSKQLIKIHKLLLNVSIFSLFTQDIMVRKAYFIDPVFFSNTNENKKR